MCITLTGCTCRTNFLHDPPLPKRLDIPYSYQPLTDQVDSEAVATSEHCAHDDHVFPQVVCVVQSGWKGEELILRVALRYASMESGGQCVTINGKQRMPMWSVTNSGSLTLVSRLITYFWRSYVIAHTLSLLHCKNESLHFTPKECSCKVQVGQS